MIYYKHAQYDSCYTCTSYMAIAFYFTVAQEPRELKIPLYEVYFEQHITNIPKPSCQLRPGCDNEIAL